MSGSRSFFVSDVEVVARGLPEAIAEGLSACFGSCRRAPLPARTRVVFEVERRGDGFRVMRDGEFVAGAPGESTLLPALERALYDAFPAWHPPPRAILHAAGVSLGERVLVFAGSSGAGKTAFARAFLELGAGYLGDETIFTDGERLWGFPRALQFDVLPEGAPPPPWLGEVDLRSYRFESDAGISVRPLLPPPEEAIRPGPHPASSARVILLERGERDTVEPASAIDALRVLTTEAFGRVETNLGPLLRAPLRVRWNDPRAAAERLLRHLP